MINRVVVIDSHRYVLRDPFQSQIHHAIRSVVPDTYRYRVLLPGKTEIASWVAGKCRTGELASDARFVLAARQRTLFAKIDELQKLIGDKEVVLYEQDPWESFIDGSKTHGFLDQFCQRFNLKKVIVTSNYWREILQKRLSCEVEFATMNVDPRLIPFQTIPMQQRHKQVEFKGSMKEHRKIAFERMTRAGLTVKTSASNLRYAEFLNYLQQLKIFVHDESGFYSCRDLDGYERIPRGAGLWAKEIECASQGTFAIRNYHEDSNSYGLEKIPLVRLYRQPEDVVQVVDEILSMNDEELLDIQERSKSELLKRNGWIDLVTKLMR